VPASTERSDGAVEGKARQNRKGRPIQGGEGVAGWVAATQQPRVNVTAPLDVARLFTPEETIELSAATAVAVVHGPDMLGVLACYTVAYSAVAPPALHVVDILAEPAAPATHSRRRTERHSELASDDAVTVLG